MPNSNPDPPESDSYCPNPPDRRSGETCGLKVLERKARKKEYRERQKQKQKRWFAYAISDGEFLKVGITRNVKSRLGDLQVGHPKTLRVCAVREFPYWGAMKSFECQWQKGMKKAGQHVRGEWFELDALQSFIKPLFSRNSGVLIPATEDGQVKTLARTIFIETEQSSESVSD